MTALPDWMQQVQDFGQLTPEMMQAMTSNSSSGYTQYSPYHYGGYTINPMVNQGTGMDNVGNNSLTGYAVLKDGASLNPGDYYGAFDSSGKFTGAQQNPGDSQWAGLLFAAATAGLMSMPNGLFDTISGAAGTAGNTAQQGFRASEIAAQNAGAGALEAGAGGGVGSVFNAAQDSQLASSQLGLDPVTTMTPPATYLPTSDPSQFIPGVDSAASGQPPYVAPETPPAVPVNGSTGVPPGSGGAPTVPGTTPSVPSVPRVPTVPGTSGGGDGSGGGGSGFDLSSLFPLIAGLSDMNNQNHASEDMLNYLKQRQTMNDNMYAPGSPEATALWDEMSRKDAAAGRNSQYGPRSVDLGARIAQLKMDANTRMTTGIGSLYQNAINQGASSNAGLMTALGQLFNNNGSGTGGSGLDMTSLLRLINGGNGSTTINPSNGSEVPGSNGSDNGGIQTGSGGLNTWPELGD